MQHCNGPDPSTQYPEFDNWHQHDQDPRHYSYQSSGGFKCNCAIQGETETTSTAVSHGLNQVLNTQKLKKVIKKLNFTQ